MPRFAFSVGSLPIHSSRNPVLPGWLRQIGWEVNVNVTKTLYVGNLPWGTTEDELTAFFAEQAEVVACRIITDRETGRSRGFGFVEVPADDAERVIEALNGVELDGRALNISEAQPRARRF